MNPNFSLSVVEDDKVYLSQESFRPLQKIGVVIRVLMDAQHDGRMWREDFVEEKHRKLVEEIMSQIRPRVEDFVRKTNPYGIHRETPGDNDDAWRIERGEEPLFPKG
jgi:hypothetical protein